jgi:WD40 repeat protein
MCNSRHTKGLYFMRGWQRCLISITGLILSQVVTAAYPDDLSRITIDNASEVDLLARVGGDTIFNIEWSHDSQDIAVASRNGVALYEANDFHSSPKILNPNICSPWLDECRSVVHYTPDGTLIMVGSGQTLTIYDAASGQQRAIYRDDHEVNNVAYDSVHKRLVHINNRAYGGYKGAVFTPTFDPYQVYTEPQPLLPADVGDSPRVGFWEDDTGDFVLSPDGSSMAALYVAYYPRIDSGAGDPFGYQSSSAILLYDLDPIFANLPLDQGGLDYGYQIWEEDLAKHRLELAHDGSVLAMAFSRDGRLLASGTSENTVYLWDVPNGSLSSILKGHNGPVNDVAFSPDGRTLASVAGDGSARLWNMNTLEARYVINGLRVSLTTVAFSPDGTRLAVGGYDGSLWIFDAQTGTLLDSRVAHWGSIWQMSLNPQGTLLAVGNDKNEVVLYDIVDTAPYLHETRTLTGHQGMVYAVEFHPDGVHLASGSSDGTVSIWDTSSGEREKTYDLDTMIFDLAYSPDGACLMAATKTGYEALHDEQEEAGCLWGFNNQRSGYGVPPVTESTVYSLAFNPQGTMLALADETSLYIVSADTGMVASQNMHRSWSDSYRPTARSKVVFSQDGQVLFNGSLIDSSIAVFMDNRPSVDLYGGLLALSPDGTLVAGSDLGIYETSTGTMLHASVERPYWTENLVRDAVFTPDSHLIITADIEGTLNVWGVNTQGEK